MYRHQKNGIEANIFYNGPNNGRNCANQMIHIGVFESGRLVVVGLYFVFNVHKIDAAVHEIGEHKVIYEYVGFAAEFFKFEYN